MDLIYLSLTAALWVLVLGLTYGCARLQPHGGGL
jgi:hypothetical protein